MKKVLLVSTLFMICLKAVGQTGSYNVINLSHQYDQIRFVVPGEPRYYLMSKTYDTNDRALALYSAEDNTGGTWFFTVRQGTGDFILHKGNFGIGATTPTAGLHIQKNTGLKIDAETNGGHPLVVRMVDGIEEGAVSRDDVLFESNGAFLFKLDKNGNGISQIPGFVIFDDNNNSLFMVNETNGNVLINKTSQTNSTYKLDVNGKIRSNEIVVNTTGADFIFEPEYELPQLELVERYIWKTSIYRKFLQLLGWRKMACLLVNSIRSFCKKWRSLRFI